MKDLMLDLETLGGINATAICQIGACYFDRNTGEIGKTFKVNVDARTSGQIDADTIYWWLGQSKEAQHSITTGVLLHERQALTEFSAFAEDAKCIWSHATFDFVGITLAYKRHGIKPSFHYRVAKDIRTLVDLAGVTIDKTPRTGLHHDALEDCKHQVKYCVEAFRAIAKRKDFKW